MVLVAIGYLMRPPPPVNGALSGSPVPAPAPLLLFEPSNPSEFGDCVLATSKRCCALLWYTCKIDTSHRMLMLVCKFGGIERKISTKI